MAAAWKQWALALAGVVALSLFLVVELVGPGVLLWAAVLCACLLYWAADVLLGQLACWGIGRVPQAYRWSIERISVRPNFFGEGAWSEVVVSNWTWHNPAGFDEADGLEGSSFLLQIDELTLRLKLSSIQAAVTRHKAIEVGLLRARGLRFGTRRNRQGALNLWQALDLPDDDVNVRSITRQAYKYGGLDDDGEGEAPEVVPLPPVSTAATRAAAEYWRPEWGEKPPPNVGPTKSMGSGTSSHRSSPAHSQPTPDLEQPLLEDRYVEEPIGDPRRRPRWGVPVRFDIHQVVLTEVQLWVLDLLTMDTHKTAQGLDPCKTRIDVKTVKITRCRLEAGDDRRAGSVDGVHGVYLGELVWVIVAEVIPLVLKRAPWALSRTAALAAGFAVKDMAKRLAAHAVEAAHSAGHALREAAHIHGRAHGERSGCRVQVHLIGGRQVTRKGYSVNSHALLELFSPEGVVVAEARSEPQMWTKAPHWDETFELGPAMSANATLRVTLYHRRSRQVVGITHGPKERPERFVGEVALPLKAMLLRDAVIAEGGEIVGWFQLLDPRGLRHGTACTGQLKLGLRLTEAELLQDRVQAAADRSPSAPQSCGDYAILR